MKAPPVGVGVNELRDGLRTFACVGETLVGTNQGRAVARFMPLDDDPFDRLVAEGAISLPQRAPSRPRPVRLRSGASVSNLVAAERAVEQGLAEDRGE